MLPAIATLGQHQQQFRDHPEAKLGQRCGATAAVSLSEPASHAKYFHEPAFRFPTRKILYHCLL
jgi:hypothetical protein